MSWEFTNRVWIWLGETWTNIGVSDPLDFPNSPTNGEVFGPFAWSSSEDRWNFV